LINGHRVIKSLASENLRGFFYSLNALEFLPFFRIAYLTANVRGIAVGRTGVGGAVGGTGVAVRGMGVGAAAGAPHPAKAAASN
jgi:hypothetical protein